MPSSFWIQSHFIFNSNIGGLKWIIQTIILTPSWLVSWSSVLSERLRSANQPFNCTIFGVMQSRIGPRPPRPWHDAPTITTRLRRWSPSHIGSQILEQQDYTMLSYRCSEGQWLGRKSIAGSPLTKPTHVLAGICNPMRTSGQGPWRSASQLGTFYNTKPPKTYNFRAVYLNYYRLIYTKMHQISPN